MWRLEKVELRIGKNYFFAECQIKKRSANSLVCRVPRKNTRQSTRQTSEFAECFFLPSVLFLTLGKRLVDTRQNRLFVECPMECTRQTFRHSANAGFTVVAGVWTIVFF